MKQIEWVHEASTGLKVVFFPSAIVVFQNIFRRLRGARLTPVVYFGVLWVRSGGVGACRAAEYCAHPVARKTQAGQVAQP